MSEYLSTSADYKNPATGTSKLGLKLTLTTLPFVTKTERQRVLLTQIFVGMSIQNPNGIMTSTAGGTSKTKSSGRCA